MRNLRNVHRLIATRFGIAVTVLAAAALSLRLWFAFGPLGGVDSDEAIIGLIALRMVRAGELAPFYWGQDYGGTLDSLVATVPLAIFGTSTAVMKIPTFCEGMLTWIVTWRIAHRLMPRQQAMIAGILTGFWPAVIVWKASKINGFYTTTALLGLLAWLLVLKIGDDDATSNRTWVLFGFVTGLGWWCSPNMVYYALPLGLWLIARGHGRRWRQIGLAMLSFAIGSLPWILANVRRDWASLRVPDWAADSTYFSRLGFFFREGLPLAFGLRRPGDGAWLGGAAFAIPILVALLALLAVYVVNGFLEMSSAAFLLGAAPFVFAIFPGNWMLFDGRYLYFVATLLPFAFASYCGRRATQTVTAFLATVLLVLFLRAVPFLKENTRPSTEPMIAALQQEGFDTVVAQYWIAYQMTFEADEQIIASPNDTVRYLPYASKVADSRAAFVFERTRQPSEYRWVLDNLAALGIGHRIIAAGEFIAILPEAAWVPASVTVAANSG